VTAGPAGTPQLKQFLMVNIKTKFPRGINSDQAISGAEATAEVQRATGPGLRSYPLSGNGGKLDSLQTLADKAQAPSNKLREIQASSGKHQAPRHKLQASSHKRQAPGPWTLEKVSSTFDQGTLLR